MNLQNLLTTKEKSSKRVGRGYGSGKGGHTVGRGNKGQRARVGRGIPLWFEGGQLPFVKRLPYLRGKLRFQSLMKKPQLVPVSMVAALNVSDITLEVLHKHGLVKSPKLPVKLTGGGSVTKALHCTGVQASGSARSQIEKAGGTLH
ncbi:MAG: 50S ribosomal protein L15 [Candidatus Pacebacteria bacterium]|nr:50S ribosomal protein L15 [Candidatus Paceibacterota bacterium]